METNCNIPYVLKNQNSLYFKKELQPEVFILILPIQIQDYKASIQPSLPHANWTIVLCRNKWSQGEAF